MRIAGVGCRKGATAAEVLAAIDAASAAYGLQRNAIDALAVVEAKRHEPGVVEAARTLGLGLIAVAPENAPETLSSSARSLAATGTPSASEAAALAAAGEGARLLGPRIAMGGATCAIAEGGGRR